MNSLACKNIFDDISLFCLCVFVFILPVAHTETIRAFTFGIPVGIWLIRMLLKKRLLIRHTPLDLPILLFTLIAALSLLTAVDFSYSLDELFGDWILGVLLFYLVANTVRPEQMKYILGALLLGNGLMVGYGIADFFYHGGTVFSYHIRAESLHSGFGPFSAYLVTVSPYLLLSLFWVERRSYRWGLILLILLNLLALYLTFARAAWGAVGILFIWAGWRHLPRKIFLFGGAVMLIMIVLAIPQGVWKHYAPLLHAPAGKTHLETGEARWELLKFTFGQIAENPFQMLGYGRRSFVKKYGDFYLKYKGALLWHAHNTFLNFALQTGIQGLVFFCFLIYKLLGVLYKEAREIKFPGSRYFLQATFWMVLVFFMRNLFDDFFVDDSALLFWYLSGVAMSIKEG
jgi:O-antigen ligase